MVSYRENKKMHEDSVLSSFGEYLKGEGKSLNVKTKPDPPDAFVEISGSDTWIEITDAFYSEDVAISITSYAADDVVHRPSQGGLVGDPYETTTSKVESVISNKISKKTMIAIANSNGKGILLVGLYGPYFELDEVADNLSTTLNNILINQQVFDSVFLYQNCNEHMHRYRKVL